MMIMLISALYDFYSASSLNNNVQLNNVLWLRHIILIPSQQVFALSPLCCVLSGEAPKTNFVVSGLTPEQFENKGNNKITELRTIFQRESKNS